MWSHNEGWHIFVITIGVYRTRFFILWSHLKLVRFFDHYTQLIDQISPIKVLYFSILALFFFIIFTIWRDRPLFRHPARATGGCGVLRICSNTQKGLFYSTTYKCKLGVYGPIVVTLCYNMLQNWEDLHFVYWQGGVFAYNCVAVAADSYNIKSFNSLNK